MPPKRRRPRLILPLLLACAGLNPSAGDERPTMGRGVTVSCWGWGREWAEPGLAASFDELRGLGATCVAIHPYGNIRADGRISHRQRSDDPTVLGPLAAARARGLQLLLKPHIGYWGSPFSWRGDIRFDEEADWERFFKEYEGFITTQAAMAEAGEAALFSVGCELKGTLHREADWRRIIKAVRAKTTRPLIYSANWDSYDRVPFWDALDRIGIQAYFPLSEEEDPSLETLRAAWRTRLRELQAFAKAADKPLIFTELGYDRSETAAARPWETGGANTTRARALKLRCVEAALTEVEASGAVEAVYLWKWFPTSRRMSHDFHLQYPEMTGLLGRLWRSTQPAPREAH